MSPNTGHTITPSTESEALQLVYRHLGAIHATLAEADRIDEGLQRRTLDRLMDILEIIEDTPRPSTEVRHLLPLAFFPCERVKPAVDGRVIVHPLESGEAPAYPAFMEMALYGRFTGAIGAYAIDLVLVSLDTRESFKLGSAGIEIEDPEQVGDFTYPTRVSFPRPGRYEFQFRANGQLVARHPWLASLDPAART